MLNVFIDRWLLGHDGYQAFSRLIDRVQAMEAKLRSQQDEAEQDRSKADELITKLQQSITSLETALANEKYDNNTKV